LRVDQLHKQIVIVTHCLLSLLFGTLCQANRQNKFPESQCPKEEDIPKTLKKISDYEAKMSRRTLA